MRSKFAKSTTKDTVITVPETGDAGFYTRISRLYTSIKKDQPSTRVGVAEGVHPYLYSPSGPALKVMWWVSALLLAFTCKEDVHVVNVNVSHTFSFPSEARAW
jgi:hypothetical protein